MTTDAKSATRPDRQVLEELVAEADTGNRHPAGIAAALLLVVAVGWSLFQLWYASPLPFIFGFLILNDTEARAIHLGFAMFLAFACYPAFRRSPRSYVPAVDWLFAVIGAVAATYLFTHYRALAERPGTPIFQDLLVAGIGLLLLLEAARRCLGPPMVIVAVLFIAFTFAGPYMPEAIQHKGSSASKFLQHQWLFTEGVFGVALGVSTSFVFLFVLFGSLLDKAGAGNYIMQMSFSLLGHLRGGPAKVAVVSSGLTGLISGSSVSNVVSTGIFTIPMMKRVGISGVKAGAVEASSSINGQIMPPVMGAAAFLMVEYVGIPYTQIVKHALVPALISYVALFYMVHLEALKIGAEPLKRSVIRPARERLLRLGLGWSGSIAVICALYYAILGVKAMLGDAAPWVIAVLAIAGYVGLIAYAARFPSLKLDDPSEPIIHLPEAWDVARTGFHFMLPIIVLLWCLMVEQMSPGLSAFWGTVTIIALLLTQRPLFALFRDPTSIGAAAMTGLRDLVDGLNTGARNMISIGVATATAGIIVGTVTLTGMGLMMTDLVEFISGGNVIAMLLLTAFICLILGMGIPTTANYILVATLMAPVIVELGAQGGIAIPLIAVHLFVFYFGIMADVTPPVGLASFAAAAISGENPIKTGMQGALYSLRTAVLPFLFVFNPQILLIGLEGWADTTLVIAASVIAMLAFSAATMGWFMTRSRIWESALLLLACFTLFRPGFWLDMVYDPYDHLPPSKLYEVAERLPGNGRITFTIEGISLEGRDVSKTVSLPVGAPAAGPARLAESGVRFMALGDTLQVGPVQFGSYARRIGLETGFDVTGVLVPADRPSKYWMFVPALLVIGLVALLQTRRRRSLIPAPA